ncbi:MAG: Uncharacterized protein Athens101428_590 [Candidatus Berkelbacteria bacterium Athens1014_28]|uniref:Uncharacterized protein n=1 Tax=Candidatus Berkelbacteria bacterium Athens1014_28 TaxID=2017145 RepID=A0A554LLZ8_9BACT|nr:MAG: Uncharacterized protein Athens101428_590 [Candidatus Berkelbacteria bacterium Athens1014_28]
MHKIFKIYLAFVFLLAATTIGAYLVVKNSYSADPLVDDGRVTICPAPTYYPDDTTPAEREAIADAAEPQIASAAEASQDDFIEVFVSPASDRLNIKSGGKVKINLSVRSQKDPSQDYKATIDHISVFATGAGKSFPKKDAKLEDIKNSICNTAGAISGPQDPFVRLLGQTTCDARGDCKSVDFDNPTELGRHQIFAVAMKSDTSTPCDANNILGWSTNSESTITVYNSTTVSGRVLTLDFPDNVEADKNFNIHIKTDPSGTTRKIDHVSTLILKVDPGVEWKEIDNNVVCELAKKNVKDITQCSATGLCDTDRPISLSQSGQHRIIGVAMESKASEECFPGDETRQSNIISFSKDGIITVNSKADPAGTGTDDGESIETDPVGDDDLGSLGKKPTWLANLGASSMRTIQDAVGRVGSIGLMILGFIAVLAIVLAGMKYITAGGDQQKAQVAKKAVLFAVYGIIAATLAVVLVKMTVSEVQKIVAERLAIGSGSFEKTIIPPTTPESGDFAGPNASVLSFFGHKDGLIWQIIRLAVSWAEVVAFFMILWASYLYMTSFGEDAKAESAKKTLIWAVIGLAVVLSANVIINSLGQLLA